MKKILFFFCFLPFFTIAGTNYPIITCPSVEGIEYASNAVCYNWGYLYPGIKEKDMYLDMKNTSLTDKVIFIEDEEPFYYELLPLQSGSDFIWTAEELDSEWEVIQALFNRTESKYEAGKDIFDSTGSIGNYGRIFANDEHRLLESPENAGIFLVDTDGNGRNSPAFLLHFQTKYHTLPSGWPLSSEIWQKNDYVFYYPSSCGDGVIDTLMSDSGTLLVQEDCDGSSDCINDICRFSETVESGVCSNDFNSGTYGVQPATTTLSGCESGYYEDVSDSSTEWKWQCMGINSSENEVCTASKNSDIEQDPICSVDTVNSCIQGSFTDLDDSDINNIWKCTSNNTDAICHLRKSINATCGTEQNTCNPNPGAVLEDLDDSDLEILWNCNGNYGGTGESCSLEKPVCSTVKDVCIQGDFQDLLDTSDNYNWRCVTSEWMSASCAISKTSVISPICSTTTRNTCTEGTFSDSWETSTQYTWNCNGINTNEQAQCSLDKTTPVDGVCSTVVNECISGNIIDESDTNIEHNWKCQGMNGWGDVSCSLEKTAEISITLSKDSEIAYSAESSATVTVTITNEGNISLKDIYTEIPNTSNCSKTKTELLNEYSSPLEMEESFEYTCEYNVWSEDSSINATVYASRIDTGTAISASNNIWFSVIQLYCAGTNGQIVNSVNTANEQCTDGINLLDGSSISTDNSREVSVQRWTCGSNSCESTIDPTAVACAGTNGQQVDMEEDVIFACTNGWVPTEKDEITWTWRCENQFCYTVIGDISSPFCAGTNWENIFLAENVIPACTHSGIPVIVSEINPYTWICGNYPCSTNISSCDSLIFSDTIGNLNTDGEFEVSYTCTGSNLPDGSTFSVGIYDSSDVWTAISNLSGNMNSYTFESAGVFVSQCIISQNDTNITSAECGSPLDTNGIDISITSCGDGIRNNDEACDYNDPTESNWGDDGCDTSCEKIDNGGGWGGSSSCRSFTGEYWVQPATGNDENDSAPDDDSDHSSNGCRTNYKTYTDLEDTEIYFQWKCSNSICKARKAIGPSTVAVCGNGVLETGETCDDGNSESGDGCSALCAYESLCGSRNTLSNGCLYGSEYEYIDNQDWKCYGNQGNVSSCNNIGGDPDTDVCIWGTCPDSGDGPVDTSTSVSSKYSVFWFSTDNIGFKKLSMYDSYGYSQSSFNNWRNNINGMVAAFNGSNVNVIIGDEVPLFRGNNDYACIEGNGDFDFTDVDLDWNPVNSYKLCITAPEYNTTGKTYLQESEVQINNFTQCVNVPVDGSKTCISSGISGYKWYLPDVMGSSYVDIPVFIYTLKNNTSVEHLGAARVRVANSSFQSISGGLSEFSTLIPGYSLQEVLNNWKYIEDPILDHYFQSRFTSSVLYEDGLAHENWQTSQPGQRFHFWVFNSSIDFSENIPERTGTPAGSIGSDTVSLFSGTEDTYLYEDKNITLNLGSEELSGVKTVLIRNGDLIINSDVKYADADASWAFIVEDGNIIIDDSVEEISGVFMTYCTPGTDENACGHIEGNARTSNLLHVEWSVYGDISDLIKNRTYMEARLTDDGSINTELLTPGVTIHYSTRILRNPPPLLRKYRSLYNQEKIVAE